MKIPEPKVRYCIDVAWPQATTVIVSEYVCETWEEVEREVESFLRGGAICRVTVETFPRSLWLGPPQG